MSFSIVFNMGLIYCLSIYQDRDLILFFVVVFKKNHILNVLVCKHCTEVRNTHSRHLTGVSYLWELAGA